MPTKGVFISFDYDNDKDLPGNLADQAENLAGKWLRQASGCTWGQPG